MIAIHQTSILDNQFIIEIPVDTYEKLTWSDLFTEPVETDFKVKTRQIWVKTERAFVDYIFRLKHVRTK